MAQHGTELPLLPKGLWAYTGGEQVQLTSHIRTRGSARSHSHPEPWEGKEPSQPAQPCSLLSTSCVLWLAKCRMAPVQLRQYFPLIDRKHCLQLKSNLQREEKAHIPLNRFDFL